MWNDFVDFYYSRTTKAAWQRDIVNLFTKTHSWQTWKLCEEQILLISLQLHYFLYSPCGAPQNQQTKRRKKILSLTHPWHMLHELLTMTHIVLDPTIVESNDINFCNENNWGLLTCSSETLCRPCDELNNHVHIRSSSDISTCIQTYTISRFG